MPINTNLLEKLAALEQKIGSLEADLHQTAKKATAMAILATLLGTGGATGVFQLWMGARLKQQERDSKAQEQTLKEQLMAKEVEIKGLTRKLSELEVQKKTIEQYREEIHLWIEVTQLNSSGDPRLAALIEDIKTHILPRVSAEASNRSPFYQAVTQQNALSQR